MDFEKATLLHKKLDKLDDALRGQPELPRRLQDLNAVILQRAVANQTIDVYEVRAGKIAESSANYRSPRSPATRGPPSSSSASISNQLKPLKQIKPSSISPLHAKSSFRGRL